MLRRCVAPASIAFTNSKRSLAADYAKFRAHFCQHDALFAQKCLFNMCDDELPEELKLLLWTSGH